MDTHKEVEDSIKRILWAFNLGLQLIKETGESKSKGLTKKLATRHTIHEEMVRKFRVLADTNRGFSREEMDEQFRQFRMKGRSLDLSHFIRSLAVPRGSVRNSILRKALARNLSSHQLQSLIASRQPNQKRAGRKPKVMVSDNFDMVLGRLVWSWARILSANLEVNKISNPQLEDTVKKMQHLMKLILKHSRSVDS